MRRFQVGPFNRLKSEELSPCLPLDLRFTELLKEECDVIVGQNSDLQAGIVNLNDVVVTAWSPNHGWSGAGWMRPMTSLLSWSVTHEL